MSSKPMQVMDTTPRTIRINLFSLFGFVSGVGSNICLGLAFLKSNMVLFSVALVGLGLGALLGILGIFAARYARGLGARFGDTSVVLAAVGCFMMMLYPTIDSVRQAAATAKSWRNLKEMALAMHAYHDKNGCLPPVAIRDRYGKPLLSWRVAILPFIEKEDLYNQFRLDEPWDSPHNLELLKHMPESYRSSGPNRGGKFETFYQVLVGPGTAFERDGLTFSGDFPDGTAETILIIEAAESVPWTKPQEVPFDDGPLLPRLGGRARRGYLFDQAQFSFTIAFANGTPRKLYNDVPEHVLRALATRNGAEKVPVEWRWVTD